MIRTVPAGRLAALSHPVSDDAYFGVTGLHLLAGMPQEKGNTLLLCSDNISFNRQAVRTQRLFARGIFVQSNSSLILHVISSELFM